MEQHRRPLGAIFAALFVALSAGTTHATAVQDLVRIKGHERAVVTGMGIVIGLDGTGDTSKDSLVAARPYARLLTNYGNPLVDPRELERANAFAIVSVTMQIPATGGRDGDRFDVAVEKLFNAKSLAGGRLVVSLLRLPGPDAPDAPVIAFAEGPLVVDPERPASGVVRGGGQLVEDIRPQIVHGGRMTLVLKSRYAGFPVATTIADAINDEFGIDGITNIALVEDAKNIRIYVPDDDRDYPAQFIATLMTIPVDPSLIRTEARIVINERAGIITVTGDVEIGPVAITHKGMQLSSAAPSPDRFPDPAPDADPAAAGAPGAAAPVPPDLSRRWVGFDTTATGRSATRLSDLLRAFDQLSVPTEDQIAIMYELKKTGALHAEIVSQ